MADVFISYQRNDVAMAEAMSFEIDRCGFSTFFDRHIEAGTAWDVRLEEELDAATVVLVLWTANSVKSTWVRREGRRACELHKIAPARLEACRLPLEFSDLQTIDLIGWKRGATDHPGWKELLNFLGAARTSPRGDVPTGRRPPSRGEINFEIGLMHLEGDGAPKDLALARFWFEQAVSEGCYLGAIELARLHEEGRGVARDPKLAAQLLETAARQSKDTRARDAARQIISSR